MRIDEDAHYGEKSLPGRKQALFTILNDFFDKIYLINLETSTDRLTQIKRSLRGLDFEVFKGVNGQILDLEKIIAEGIYDPDLSRKNSSSGQELVRGEIGCALSHIEIYKDILRNGYRNALILEDDVTAEPTNLEVLQQSLSELPQDWEVLYLGYKNNRTKITFRITLRIKVIYPVLHACGFKKYDPLRFQRLYPRPFSQALDLAGSHYGTHAYAVSHSGANKILKSQNPICLAADNAIARICVKETVKAFLLKKRVFHFDESMTSTIEGR